MYDETIMVVYLGTQVGNIYLEDLGVVTGDTVLLRRGSKLFLDYTEPSVRKSIEKGTLKYFSDVGSSEAFAPYGAPLVVYRLIRISMA